MTLLYLELLNGALGQALILLVLILIKDFKKEFSNRGTRIQIPFAFFGLSIIVFSIKELYRYGPFDNIVDPVVSELLEMLHLLLTLAVIFLLLGLKKQVIFN